MIMIIIALESGECKSMFLRIVLFEGEEEKVGEEG